MHRFAFSLLMVLAAAGSAAADAMDRISESGVIRFGVRESSEPFSYFDEKGEPAGLAVGLCKQVAASIQKHYGVPNLRMEFVRVDANSRFEAIESGEVDVHCGPMTATISRRETLDFSVPYFMDGVGVALRREGPQQESELEGRPVGALTGTTSVDIAREWAGADGAAVVIFENHEQGLRALGRGDIDAYFGDQGLLLAQLSTLKSENAALPIRVLPNQFSYEPYALAMKAGEGRLRLEVDRALSELYLSKRIFAEIEQALGPFEMSDQAAFLYALVALPE